MLTVYLANKYIRVVEGEAGSGHIKVQGAHYTIDSGGCILNGTIVDEEGLLGLLEEIWQQHNLPRKGVNLVLDSNQFTVKIVHAPVQKEKLMQEYLSREFTDVGRLSNPVYGYFPLKGQDDTKAKILRVFAMAAPREYLLQYVSLFQRFGVTLSSIESANGSMIRLMEILPELTEKTCIVQFVDDVNLINVLIVEGRYEHSQRNRIFAEPGTAGYAVETARAVSNLLQFAKAQNIPQEVTNVYIAGISDADYAVYEDGLLQIDDTLEVAKLSGEGQVNFPESADSYVSFAAFALAVGGLVKTNLRTNIMSQLRYTPEQLEKRRKRAKVLIPLAISAGILLAVTAGFMVRKAVLTSQLNELQAYNQNPDILDACDEYDSISARLTSVSGLQNSLQQMKNQVAQYPNVDSNVEAIITACANGLVSADISAYDSATGVLSFDTSAQQVEQINQFIQLLWEREIFASVDYTGYSQSKEGEWNVKVNCTMAPRQIQEETTEEDAE